MLSHLTLFWVPESKNIKTGNIPTAWIGHENGQVIPGARESCEAVACELYKNGCYAHGGTVEVGGWSLAAGIERQLDRTLEFALAHRAKTAKAARLTAIGDLGVLSVEYLLSVFDVLREHALDIIAYSHAKDLDDALKPYVRISVNSIEEADAWLAKGWSVACVSPEGTIGTQRTASGQAVPQCPATRPGMEGKIQCNECRLCAVGSKFPKALHFPAHGKQKRKASRYAGRLR